MTKHHVFLSYNKKDEQIMLRVRDKFEKADLSVWTMQQNIPIGTPSWMIKVEQGIKESGCLVCILSPNTVASEWVREELNLARALKKQIFMILAKGDEMEVILLGYTANQWCDIRPVKKEDVVKNAAVPDYSKLHPLVETLQERFGITQKKRKVSPNTIFVSASIDQNLTPEQIAVKKHLLDLLVGQNLKPLLIGEVDEGLEMTWSFDGVIEVMADCAGAIILGLTRWQFVVENYIYRFPTEYTHFEGALALSNALPTLIIKEYDVPERGIFYTGGGRFIITLPSTAAEEWLESDEFRQLFEGWHNAVKEHL